MDLGELQERRVYVSELGKRRSRLSGAYFRHLNMNMLCSCHVDVTPAGISGLCVLEKTNCTMRRGLTILVTSYVNIRVLTLQVADQFAFKSLFFRKIVPHLPLCDLLIIPHMTCPAPCRRQAS